ncbi:MAG: hypothetical protein ACQEQ4_01215 [Fibrobacterota bacterium]
MRFKTVCAALFIIASAATAQDYLFPSVNPPGGFTPEEVNQYITIIWDDNAYSGKTGTNYEPEPPPLKFTEQGWVGGRRVEGDWSTDGVNPLSLEEGDMGMTWAAYSLTGFEAEPAMNWSSMVAYSGGDQVRYNDTVWEATGWAQAGEPPFLDPRYPDQNGGDWEHVWKYLRVLGDQSPTKTNPDGSQIKFTFNVISGLMVPTWPSNWQARESDYGYYVPNEEFYPEGTPETERHSKIAASWGREMPIYSSEAKEEVFVQGYINQAYEEALLLGHEIGNHTIDHMESNSPLPNAEGEPISALPDEGGMAYKDGFSRWGGDGRGTQNIDTLPWGEVVNQAELFGQREGNIWQYMGWRIKAGSFISKDAWTGAVTIGEEELTSNLDLSVANGNLHAFRAPRLEVNSNLYYALGELGYQYDCGLQEGYEGHRDGTNFLWPYTMDNGSPNVTYQRLVGVDVRIDSTPQSLWQIPVNVFIVPEEHREEVWNNRKRINDNALDGGDMGNFEEWAQNGKITGFDFNLYVMWGMTKDIWLATMKDAVNKRLNGNKAPIQYGAHTDYYTPIYDNATLLNDVNAPSYGLNITEGWNTWEDRVSSLEEFVDWSIDQGSYFVSGHELIERLKDMENSRQYGDETALSSATWTFFKNEDLDASSAEQNSFTGNITNAKITTGTDGDGENIDYRGYSYYADASVFDELDHISFDYQTSAPLAVRLITSSGDNREVIISHVNGPSMRNSGPIPVAAFEQNQYSDIVGYQEELIDNSDIIGIEIEVLTDGMESYEHELTVENFTLYQGAGMTNTIDGDETNNRLKSVAVTSFREGNLSLMVGTQGSYSVSLVSPQGRTIQSFDNTHLSAGINNLNFEPVAPGVYFIRLSTENTARTVRALAL